jgi:hypothetical protein
MPRDVYFDLNGTLVDPGALIKPRELALAALDEANVYAMIVREAAFSDLLDAALPGRRPAARAPRTGPARRRAGDRHRCARSFHVDSAQPSNAMPSIT